MNNYGLGLSCFNATFYNIAVYNIYNDMLCTLFTGDAIEFMSWFLNAVHGALNGNRKLSSSIVNKTFRGTMRVYTHKMLPIEMVSTIYSYDKMIEI